MHLSRLWHSFWLVVLLIGLPETWLFSFLFYSEVPGVKREWSARFMTFCSLGGTSCAAGGFPGLCCVSCCPLCCLDKAKMHSSPAVCGDGFKRFLHVEWRFGGLSMQWSGCEFQDKGMGVVDLSLNYVQQLKLRGVLVRKLQVRENSWHTH